MPRYAFPAVTAVLIAASLASATTPYLIIPDYTAKKVEMFDPNAIQLGRSGPFS